MANFVVSGTPHVRSKESIQSIMRDVIIALVPATAMGIYYFGIPALILVIAAIVSAVAFEAICQKIMKKPVTVSDLSAVVTGLLLAMNLPATAPVWVAIVGSAFAIIFGKQLFGGLGQNFINPALAGRAFLLASYPTEMTTWTMPNGLEMSDVLSAATGAADAATYTSTESLAGANLVAEEGSAGESALLADEFLSGANYTPVVSMATTLMEIKAGTADAAVVDYTMASAMVGEGTDYSDLMIIEGVDLAVEEYAIAFRLGSNAVEKVNEVMAKLIEDGTLDAIAEKYELTASLLSNQ